MRYTIEFSEHFKKRLETARNYAPHIKINSMSCTANANGGDVLIECDIESLEWNSNGTVKQMKHIHQLVDVDLPRAEARLRELLKINHRMYF